MTAIFTLTAAGRSYHRVRVLHPVSLTMEPGHFIAVGGPNGAGKSTLLSLLSGLAKPDEGRCCFHHRDVHRWPRRLFAQQVALVQQAEPSAFPFTAFEVVAMGRTPHSSRLFESPDDRFAVSSALARTGTTVFAHRDFRTLSGGEKQRVLLASALAQQPQVLLLDEPANHLDLEHQVSLHQLLRELADAGLLVVAITHDLNLAAAYADRLILLDKGEIKADGAPASVLTPALIQDVFHVSATVGSSAAGKPWLSYGPLHA